MAELPLTIGAALTVASLETYRDWLFERDRDLELQDFHWVKMLDGDWQARVDAARAMLDGFNGRLGIHGPFWGFQIDSMDPEIRAVVTRRMLQGLEICERLGAVQMVIHSPYNPWTFNHDVPGLPPSNRAFEEAHATLGPVVRRAEEIGVHLAVENIADVDPAKRMALIESFGSEAVRASIDTGHAALAHGSFGGPPVDYFVRAAGARLAHVHLQDADGHGDRHWALGRGAIPWHAVLDAIAATGASPHLVLELRDHGDVPESMAYLERLGLAA